MGPFDGHDVTALRENLEAALDADRPVVVHIHTVKGKGFEPAEEGGLEGMEKWHAAKPGSIVEGRPAPKKPAAKPPLTRGEMSEGARPEEAAKPPPAYTSVFGDALVVEAKRDSRVIGITAAMAGGTGLTALEGECPEQYYDVGIAEQDAVLFAAGLAIQGAKPVCAIYSTFLQRAYDQLVHDVCLQKLNVVVRDGSRRAGRRRRPDPPRRLRRLLLSLARRTWSRWRPATRRCSATCCAPRSPTTTARSRFATRAAPPRACRCPTARARSRSGRARLLREGERVALLGYGYGVRVALDAAALLAEHDLSVTVADARFAKPLDYGLVERLAAEHELLVTIEENVLAGGFGSGVLEHVEDAFAGAADRARVLRVGLPDRYVTHGKPALLREEVGLTGGGGGRARQGSARRAPLRRAADLHPRPIRV